LGRATSRDGHDEEGSQEKLTSRHFQLRYTLPEKVMAADYDGYPGFALGDHAIKNVINRILSLSP